VGLQKLLVFSGFFYALNKELF